MDLDVLDSSFGAANEYAVPDGLSPSEMDAIVETVSGYLPIRAIGIASFDPAHAPDGQMTEIALALILNAVSLAGGSRQSG